MKLNLRVLSIVVMAATGMIGAVQVAGPESLGISAVAIRWLGIVAAGLAIVQGFLPKVQGPSTDPVELADRVWNLDHESRLKVLTELESRRVGSPAIDPATPQGRATLDALDLPDPAAERRRG